MPFISLGKAALFYIYFILSNIYYTNLYKQNKKGKVVEKNTITNLRGYDAMSSY